MKQIAIVLLVVSMALPGFAQMTGEEKKTAGGLSYILRKGKKPQGAPIMILLHGSGGDLNVFAEMPTGWAGSAESSGYILAVPRGSNGGKEWANDDESKILELVDELVKGFGADSKRVYVGGFSSGAFRAMEWGLKHPDVFAGVLSICGGCRADIDSFPEASKEMGVYVIAASNDQYVKFEDTKAAVDKLKAKGYKNLVFKEKKEDHVRYHEEAGPFYKWAMGFARKFVPGSNATLAWAEDATKAIEGATTDKKKLLIYFFSPKDATNPACEAIEGVIFKDKDVIAALGDFVCVKVDRDKEKDLAKKYKASKPMAVLVDTEKSKVLYTLAEATTPKSFVDQIKKALGKK
jgi:predicted esterase